MILIYDIFLLKAFLDPVTGSLSVGLSLLFSALMRLVFYLQKVMRNTIHTDEEDPQVTLSLLNESLSAFQGKDSVLLFGSKIRTNLKLAVGLISLEVKCRL